ncbi:MAG: hypothetical protein ACOY93_02580 [Bacillota bacterium]
MNWLFLAAFSIFVAWVLWRGYEAYSFRQLLDSLNGEMTDETVRSFMERLATRSVPSAGGFWGRLKELENRVTVAPQVSQVVQAEFRTMLQSKGLQL